VLWRFILSNTWFFIGDVFLKMTGVTSSLRGDEDEGDAEEENALPFSIVALTAGI
jgi:hypothetical protein